MAAAPQISAWLIPIAGPRIEPIELASKPGGVIVGRHENCDVLLPPDAEQVSRVHARFNHDGAAWRLADLKSRWGTFVNGVQLTEGREVLLSEGDLVRISPWTFSFSLTGKQRGGVDSFNDVESMHTMVRSIAPERAGRLAEDLLTLLLECATGIHAAADEQALAQVLLDAASRGTGLPNAAMLRPLDGAGRVEVIASRGPATARGSAIYSRSLLSAASNGVVAELAGGDDGTASESIIQNRINAAICVPLMLGSTVAAYLYLDARGSMGTQGLRPNASAFCVALGRMAGLALANLKRVDIERRQTLIEAELSAGAEAQRWILPQRHHQVGAFSVIGESRAGRYVGGDFFDVVELPGARLAIALGDVAGKGVGASVLMTAAQGFLHAALEEHGQPGRAASDLNRFVLPRRPEGKFLTMWLGVFDLTTHTLSYVDAGHGYALLFGADGSVTTLAEGNNLPIGVMDGMAFAAETVQLPPGGRAIVVSDGIIEQFGSLLTAPNGKPEQFELAGVERALKDLPRDQDAVAALFAAVIAHAGTERLADDATAVMIKW